MSARRDVGKFRIRISRGIFIVFFASTAASGNNVTLDFANRDRASPLCLQTNVDKFTDLRECGEEGSVYKVDATTRRFLQNASSLIPVLSTADRLGKWAILISRVPSNPRSPQGFCGAGYEDSLLLIRLEKGSAKLTDQSILQSCRKSISLESDRNDSFVDAVGIDNANIVISFRWLSDPEGLSRLVRIVNGKFQIESVVDKTETDTN